MDLDVHPPGEILCDGRRYRCALGRIGVTQSKREGDGATPVGTFPLRRVLYRPDRLPRPATGLPVRAIRPDDGWCDDPDHPSYNRMVHLPFEAGHEPLWREDRLYDIVVEMGFNDDPPVPFRGSAIFLHVARPDFGPTLGCIAMALDDVLAVLSTSAGETRIRVHGRAAEPGSRPNPDGGPL